MSYIRGIYRQLLESWSHVQWCKYEWGCCNQCRNVWLVLQNAVIDFYSNKIGPAYRLFALFWGFIFKKSLLLSHIFKVAFLCSLLSHCFSCTNGKIWEPSGGQNNICKSHSALSTSAWSNDRVKLCWSCIINMFHHLCLLLSMYLGTWPVCHCLLHQMPCIYLDNLNNMFFIVVEGLLVFNCWSHAQW